MAKKWMQLKIFQLMHTHTYITYCWSVYNTWSYVNSLGLNACKRVVFRRRGMNLFLMIWVGFVSSRWNNECVYIKEEKTLVIMKWFHLTCCEKKIWKRSFPIDLVGGFPLSWRLSHACLSMNWFKVKLRTAHYISYNFLWS